MRAPKLIVAKSNRLVEAAYHLTLNEHRVILLVLAKLDSQAPLQPGISHTIAAAEFASAYGLARDVAYEALSEATERLYERSLIVTAPFPDRPDIPSLKTRWVASVRYQARRGGLELVFSPDVLPLLSRLKSEFSLYRLAHVSAMTSTHAIRLYELLIQWRSTGSRQVDLAWLRERFDLGEKYANIRDLKRFVLVPAVEQVNAHSDIWVKWEQHKQGRTVVSLTFTFSPKLTEKPPAKKTIVDQRGWIEKNARPGETWEQARDRYLKEFRL